jgi:hypothetical protein
MLEDDLISKILAHESKDINGQSVFVPCILKDLKNEI